MLITGEPDTAFGRALADLEAAATHAGSQAALDGDPQLSPWADTAYRIGLAASFLRLQHPQLPPVVAAHPDCLAALVAAAGQIGLLRPDTDLPLRDLVEVLSHLSTALQHAGTEPLAAPLAGADAGIAAKERVDDVAAAAAAAAVDARQGGVLGSEGCGAAGDGRVDGARAGLDGRV